MEIPGAATPEFCQMMIKKYEADVRKRKALVGPEARYEKETRDSLNLEMNAYPEWDSVVADLRGMVYSRLDKYVTEVHQGKTDSLFLGGYDSSYTMMKYEEGGAGYQWHNDFIFDHNTDRGGVRTVTWIFYLNECEGGETEFSWGTKIKPETGKLLFFPSAWTFVHRGCAVTKGVKYACVGWIMSTFDKDIGKTV